MKRRSLVLISALLMLLIGWGATAQATPMDVATLSVEASAYYESDGDEALLEGLGSYSLTHYTPPSRKARWTASLDYSFMPYLSDDAFAGTSSGIYEGSMQWNLGAFAWEGSYLQAAHNTLPYPLGLFDDFGYEILSASADNGSITGLLAFVAFIDRPVFGDDWKEGILTADLSISAAPVPEPGTMVLLGIGLVGVAAASRKKLIKK